MADGVDMWIWTLTYFSLGALFIPLSRAAMQKARATTTGASAHKPSITIIKPVRGVNDSTQEAFESWLNQDYEGRLEFIFSFQEPNDPALALLEKHRTDSKFQILINEIREGFSGKGSNLYYGVESARSEYLIFSDADTIASPSAVREIVNRTRKGESMVSCLPAHTHPKSLWAKLYAMVWNWTLIGLWAPAMLKEKAPGVAGGTVGFYREDLESIGGVSGFANYVAEDLRMGALFKAKGFKLVLGPVIESKVGRLTFRQYWNALMRGSFVSWSADTGGIGKSVLVHVFAYGYAPLIIYGLIANPKILPPTMFMLAARMVFLAWYDYLAEGRLRIPVFALFNDLMTLVTLIVSLSSRQLSWANVQYRITNSGQMVRIKSPA
jgi:ceramide glucosyltransferase